MKRFKTILRNRKRQIKGDLNIKQEVINGAQPLTQVTNKVEKTVLKLKLN